MPQEKNLNRYNIQAFILFWGGGLKNNVFHRFERDDLMYFFYLQL